MPNESMYNYISFSEKYQFMGSCVELKVIDRMTDKVCYQYDNLPKGIQCFTNIGRQIFIGWNGFI